MNKQVDSYRYLDFITRQMVKAWIGLETPNECAVNGAPWFLVEEYLCTNV